MDTTQKGIITLLKSAITGNRLILPDGFDIDAAYPAIKVHHIALLAYSGALKCGIDQKKTAMQQLFQSYLKGVQVNERQMQELSRVFAAFDEKGVDYLPLKGCIMKALYPKPELRVMADADVLIRLEQYDRIVPIMNELGFAEKIGADHHFVWESDYLNLELHKHLVKPGFLKCHEHLQDAWNIAEAEDAARYTLDDVNTFAFMLTHFAQHFVDCGIGCRHVVDLWVYLRSHQQMDQAYLKTILEKMDLWSFYQNIRKLIAVWFEGEETDENTELLSWMIFSNGSWGSLTNATLNKGLQDMGKTDSAVISRAKYIWRRLFPGIACLKGEYPVLRKQPWLLPVMWSARIFKKTVGNRDIPRRHMRQLRLLNSKELDGRKKMMEYIGLSIEK